MEKFLHVMTAHIPVTWFRFCPFCGVQRQPAPAEALTATVGKTVSGFRRHDESLTLRFQDGTETTVRAAMVVRTPDRFHRAVLLVEGECGASEPCCVT